MLGLVYKYFFLSVISITKPLQKTGFLGYVQKNYIFFFNRHFLILLQNCSVLYVHSALYMYVVRVAILEILNVTWLKFNFLM